VVSPAVGAVVLVPFPFSDLSQSKLRPAVVVADAGRGDWILCQITSNAYGDARAIALSASDLRNGALRVTSFARPGKLFTASHSLLVSQVAILSEEALSRVRAAVIEMFQKS
jgi:mRNA interferase MazF